MSHDDHLAADRALQPLPSGPSDPTWCAVGLGRVCAARLGLVLAPKPRIRAPVRAGGGAEVPLLDGWDEMEINEGSEGT